MKDAAYAASSSESLQPDRDFQGFAVVLAGGSGTRLWPMSRQLLPKQLLPLSGDKSLLQETLSRVAMAFPTENVLIVTNEEHVFQVRTQAGAVNPGLDGRVLAEPQGRNTLPATLLALDRILTEAGADPAKIVFMILPSDHKIQDLATWALDANTAMRLAAEGHFVTFGVPPATPETGYGYIHAGAKTQAPGGADNAYAVRAFVEKPDLETANRYLEGGEHYWNSGMFAVRADVFLDAVEKFQPEVWKWWTERADKPLSSNYAAVPDLSLDYGVAEHIQDQAMVSARFDWDDLGSWEALFRLGNKDAKGLVSQGDVLALDCEDSLLISQGGKLAAVGVKDMIVIMTPDATLICPVSQAQKVKDVVNALKKTQDSRLLVSHVTVRRPWGSYTVLEEGPGYKIKRIEVLPGAKLSSQMHYHRAEHWVVIAGTAEVTVGEDVMLLTENHTADIPKATLHRLANPGKTPVEIIEIQSGPYLEEDDIVRFDDVYGRVK